MATKKVLTDAEAISDYYTTHDEKNRLNKREGLLEKIRTKEIISRYLHRKNLNIADIGGGTGEYSIWLKKLGHRVTLIDLTPNHIKAALATCKSEGIELDYASTGNSLKTNLQSDQFDIVLMLGPLYHLINRDERIRSLKEGYRVLRDDGILICSAIGRYTVMMYGYLYNSIDDPDFQSIVEKVLSVGVHRNTNVTDFFTDSYFHRIHDLEDEVREAGLNILKSIGIEGPFWIIDTIEKLCLDPGKLNVMLKFIKMIESEKDIIGASKHYIVVAKK